MKNFHKTNAFSIIIPLLGVILLWYLGMGWLIVLGGLGFGINSIERGIQPTHVDSKAGRVKDILFEKKGKEDVLTQHENDRNNQQGYNNQINNYNQQGYNQPFNNYNQQGYNQPFNNQPFNNQSDKDINNQINNYNQQGYNQPFNNYNQQGYNQPFNNQPFNNQSDKDMYGADIVGKPINDRVKVYYETDQYGMGRRLRGGMTNSYIEGLYHNMNIASKGVSDYYRGENTDVYSENFSTLSTDFKVYYETDQYGMGRRLRGGIRKLYIEDLGCVRDEQDLVDTHNDTIDKLNNISKKLKTLLTKLLNTSEVFDKNSVGITELRKKLNRELNNQGINNYYNGNILVEQGEGKVIFDFYELYNQLIDMYKNSIEVLTTDCKMYLDSRVGRCNNQIIEDFRNNNSELLGDCSKWFYNERLQLDNLVSKALESYKNKYLRYEDELSQQGDIIFDFKTEEDLNKETKNDYEFLHNNNNFMDTDVFNNSTNHSVNDMFGDTMVEGFNRKK